MSKSSVRLRSRAPAESLGPPSRRSSAPASSATSGCLGIAGQGGPRASRRHQQGQCDRGLAREEAEQLHLAEREARIRGTVEHLEHAEHAFLVEEGDGHDALGDVAAPLGDVACEAGVGLHVLEDERRLRGGDPAGDPGRGREPLTDEELIVFARNGGENELVRLLVEQEDRRALSAEDRTSDLDDRAQEPREVLFGGHDTCCNRGVETIRHGSP